MFEYIKQDWQNVNEKLKTMHRGDLKMKFTASVVISVIVSLIAVFFLVIHIKGELTVGSLFVMIPTMLVVEFFSIFGYIIEWRFLFHWLIAPFHGRIKVINVVLLPLIFFASEMCYMILVFIVGFKALFVMNSRR